MGMLAAPGCPGRRRKPFSKRPEPELMEATGIEEAGVVVPSHQHQALALSYLAADLQVLGENDPIGECSLHVLGCPQSFFLPPGAVPTQGEAGSGGCILRRPCGGSSKGVQRKPILTTGGV